MQGLRTDDWQLIAAHLTVRDLCRMMCVSRAAFDIFIADGAWRHQEQRICTRFPALRVLFRKQRHRNPEVAKKRRRATWRTPRKGVWWVCKQWLMLGCSFDGFWKLSSTVDGGDDVCFAVLQSALPHPERIMSWNVEPRVYSGGYRYMFVLSNKRGIRFDAVYEGGAQPQLYISYNRGGGQN